MIFDRSIRPIAAGLAGLVFLSACATNPDGTFRLDEKATGALIGAAAGCAIGAATAKKGAQGCVAGAVVGAAAGYLIAWYFESKKIADARTVNREYENQAKAGKITKSDKPPKSEITPAKFESKLTQTKHDASGGKEVQITSSTDLIGYGDRVPEVQQKYALYDESNNLLEERTEKLAAVDGAGRYQTNSKFKLPDDAKARNYTIKTTLISNNKEFKQRSYKVATTQNDHALQFVLIPDVKKTSI